MIDSQADTPYRRTPQGRIDGEKAFGAYAAQRVQKAESHLDSLDGGRLLYLRAGIIGQLIKYAEGDLRGKDQVDSYKRQSALSMLYCEVSEILESKGVDIKSVPTETQRQPILERLGVGRLKGIRDVLKGKVDGLLDQALAPGTAPEQRGALASRAILLSDRYKPVERELIGRNNR